MVRDSCGSRRVLLRTHPLLSVPQRGIYPAARRVSCLGCKRERKSSLGREGEVWEKDPLFVFEGCVKFLETGAMPECAGGPM